MERKLLCQPFTASNRSTLARHALKLICQTTFDSILFKSLLSHAGQLSCCDVTEVTWPKTGFSAADDADAGSVVFVFIQINTFTYLGKMSIYQTNSVCFALKAFKSMFSIGLVLPVWVGWLVGALCFSVPLYLQGTGVLRGGSRSVGLEPHYVM